MKIFAFRQGDRRLLGYLDGAQPRNLSAALEAAGVVESERDLLRHDFYRPQRFAAFLKRWKRFAAKLDGPIEYDLPVAAPSKVLAIGRNYAEHARELGNEIERDPVFFAKLNETLTPHESPIRLPRGGGRVDHEAELAIVVARDGRNIAPQKAYSFVAGYTCINDVTAREQQAADKSKGRPWLRAKSRDTFCPIGPYFVPVDDVLDPHALRITCRVNGEVRQSGSTADMVHRIPQVVSLVSQITTLRAGDIIALGTPSGVSPLKAGDVVEVDIEGIGCLRNSIIEDAAAPERGKEALFSELRPRLSEAIETSRDGGEALERVVAILDEAPHFHWTGVYRVEPSGVLGLGPFRGKPTAHTTIQKGKGVCGRAITADASVVVDDVTKDPEYLACSLETRSEIVVPIRAYGGPVAEIDIDSDQPRAFDARDRAFLEDVALQLGKFLERTHLPRMWEER